MDGHNNIDNESPRGGDDGLSGGINDGSHGSGGVQAIIFPFSPGDKGQPVSREGSKNGLARYVAKAGVETRIAATVSSLSVTLFTNMDDAGLHCLAGDNQVDRAILRAAQSSLKSELSRAEEVKGNKRDRASF
jgi:hypothetical protein